MQYKLLGTTGLRVSELCLGAMTFGEDWDWGANEETETMRALDDAVRAGKVMYVGISDTPAWVISRAQIFAELKNMTPFAAVQLEYNLVERTVERDLLPMAEDLNLSVLDWSPLGGGVLTGKYLKDDLDDDNRLGKAEYFEEHYKIDRAKQIAQTVVEIANEIGSSPAQVALAWIRHQSPRHIPIIGARNLDHLKDNLGCLNVSLSKDQLTRLNIVSQIDPGFALRFLRKLQNMFLGVATEKLDLSLHRTSRIVLDIE